MQKLVLSLTLLLLAAPSLLAQTPRSPSRTTFDPVLHPFNHGVASGDPLHDRVIIWTRIGLLEPSRSELVTWEVATDSGMTNVVRSGAVLTTARVDWTVKVDVDSLQPHTTYYYQFTWEDRKSLVGRTKTAPEPNQSVDRLRFAFTSCQNYTSGFYYAWRSLAELEDDIDAVFMLGDYIYEGGGGNDELGRAHQPNRETITLDEYRARYSNYRLDPDLRRAHQQYPFIVVWDDHETTNNSWRDGAENHTPGAEGDWNERKLEALRAYYEWLPIRVTDPNDSLRIYRGFQYGDLAELFFLDSRIYDRDEQLELGDSAGLADTTRRMLGPQQRQWLLDGLANSTARWKIVPQQVMFAPLKLELDTNILFFELDTSAINTDQWDGYPHERQRILQHLVDNNIDNVVVLTGDIHTHWANDVPLEFDTYADSNNSAAVEFVVTAISSGSSPINLDTTLFGVINLRDLADQLLPAVNPHIKYFNLSQKGFSILDLDTNRAQNDFYILNSVSSPSYQPATVEASWKTDDGANRLSQASAPAAPPASVPDPAPLSVDNTPTSLQEKGASLMLMYAYPNPAQNYLVLEYLAEGLAPAQLTLYNLQGQTVMDTQLRPEQPGLNTRRLDISRLPVGAYLVEVAQQNRRMVKQVVKQ